MPANALLVKDLAEAVPGSLTNKRCLEETKAVRA
jgi:hypothetical protein